MIAFCGRFFLVSACLLSAIGCTPMHSRIDPPYPYRGEDHSEVQIREVAAERCGFSQGQQTPPQIHAFTTDGCTGWRDSRWLECCIEHDIHYWCASTGSSRKQADRALRECIREHSDAANAFLMYWGTRLGGAPWLPFSWRWGYGYEWRDRPSRRGAAAPEPDTEAEQPDP